MYKLCNLWVVSKWKCQKLLKWMVFGQTTFELVNFPKLALKYIKKVLNNLEAAEYWKFLKKISVYERKLKWNVASHKTSALSWQLFSEKLLQLFNKYLSNCM